MIMRLLPKVACLHVLVLICSAKLVREFISGRNCGGTTPITKMTTMPTNRTGLECVSIEYYDYSDYIPDLTATQPKAQVCFEQDTNFARNDILGTRCIDELDCQSQCQHQPNCTCFTYVSQNCYMKNSDANREYQSPQISGYKTCGCLAVNTAYTINNVTVLNVATNVSRAEDCQLQCSAWPGCSVFTYLLDYYAPDPTMARQCVMQSSGAGVNVATVGAISGPRKC